MPYEQGRQARRNGLSLMSNPYARYSQPAQRWNAGWHDENWSVK